MERLTVLKSMLSGGAEASILLWDLERAENTGKEFVHRPVGVVRKYGFRHNLVFFPPYRRAELKDIIYIFKVVDLP